MEDNLLFLEIDLRQNPEISANLLPDENCPDVILLRVEREQYEPLVWELRERCLENGNKWLTSLLHKPEDANEANNDLEGGSTYILLAHVDLVGADIVQFLSRIGTLRKRKLN